MLGSDFLLVDAFMCHSYHDFTYTILCPEYSPWKRCDSTVSTVSDNSYTCKTVIQFKKSAVRN